MSSEALSRVIAQANTDAAFRRELVADPDAVGAASGLNDEELDALMSGDSARLRQVGVDEELSHFTLIELPQTSSGNVQLPAVQRTSGATTQVTTANTAQGATLPYLTPTQTNQSGG